MDSVGFNSFYDDIGTTNGYYYGRGKWCGGHIKGDELTALDVMKGGSAPASVGTPDPNLDPVSYLLTRANSAGPLSIYDPLPDDGSHLGGKTPWQVMQENGNIWRH